jgi:hypothetical protein
MTGHEEHMRKPRSLFSIQVSSGRAKKGTGGTESLGGSAIRGSHFFAISTHRVRKEAFRGQLHLVA